MKYILLFESTVIAWTFVTHDVKSSLWYPIFKLNVWSVIWKFVTLPDGSIFLIPLFPKSAIKILLFESNAKLIGELKLETEEFPFDDSDYPFPAKVVTE